MRASVFLFFLCSLAVAGCDSPTIDFGEIIPGADDSPVPQALVTLDGRTTAIASDATNLYLALDHRRLVRVRKSDGSSSDIAAASADVNGMCADDTFLYFTEIDDAGDGGPSGSIRRVPKSGGAPETLATGQNRPWGIVCGSDALYWTNGGTAIGDGTISSSSKSGGAPVVLVTGETQPGTIALDDASTLVWTEGPLAPSGGDVRSLSLAPGSRPTTIGPNAGVARSLAVKDRLATWITDRTIFTYSFEDGTTSSRVIGEQLVAATDTKNIYWALEDAHFRGLVEKLSFGTSWPTVALAALPPPGDPVDTGFEQFLLVDDAHLFAFDYFAQHSSLQTVIRKTNK